MTKLIHYTVNTADTFDCSSKEYDKGALKSLRPIATLATTRKTAHQKLPPPFDSYKVKITTDDGCALFDIYDNDSILTTNAIAWTVEGQSECWELFESLYLKLIGEMELVSISRAPQMPQSLPWLATFVLPVNLPSWLADFEQCLALSLIEVANHKKTKGFGK